MDEFDELPDFHPMTTLRDWPDGIGDGFCLADAVTGVVCFGATGSGKTSGPAKHLAAGYLANDFGGVVLCAKKEERHQWEEWAESAERWNRRTRKGDLVFIERGGDARFNFLDWEASRPGDGGGVTINIVALLDEIAGAIAGGAGEEGGGDNKFFEDALHHMNMNLVDLPLFAGVPVTLPLMRSIVNSAPYSLDDLKTDRYQNGDCAVILHAADEQTKTGDEERRADFEECRNYWEKEWPTLSEKTRSIIQLSFSMLVRPLITRPLRRLFCTETTVKPEDTFDGKIIIVDLPVQEYRLAGRVANLVWKYCTQIAVLRRSQPTEPGRYLRPVFLWADEYQNFASPFDSEWAAVARSAAGCTTFLVQNRESLLRVLGNAATVDSLLGNLQAKFFCQNTGDTNEWASKSVFGEHWTDITGTTTGQTDSGRADTITAGLTSSQQQRRYVDPARFSTLRRGGPKNDFRVDCFVYNGGQLFPFNLKGKDVMLPFKLVVFKQR